MNDYFSLRVDAIPCSPDITDLAASFLGDMGFESFEPDENGLTAYIRAETSDPVKLARKALDDFPIETSFSFSSNFIEGEDWNREWEKNYFKPILINEECIIHSSFHQNVPEARYNIVIDPKMAFGTGHHDTTTGMVKFILGLDLKNKYVIDVGTGTGILAILSVQCGATKVVGIEIDRPAYENAIENTTLNKVNVDLIHGDASYLSKLPEADVLLANINRNIILDDLAKYAKALRPNGIMLLSGFYLSDAPLIIQAAAPLGLIETDRLVSDTQWIALKLEKNNKNV